MSSVYQRTLFIGEIKPIWSAALNRNVMCISPFNAPEKKILLTRKQYRAPENPPPPSPGDGLMTYEDSHGEKAIALIGQFANDIEGNEYIWSITVLKILDLAEGVKLWVEWKDKNISQYFPPTLDRIV